MSDEGAKGKKSGDFGPEDTLVEFDRVRQRRDPRIEAEFRVKFETLDELVHAYTVDISQGGLFVATENFLPVGAIARLDLVLPNDGPTLQIIGRVAFMRARDAPGADKDAPPGMGFEFLDVEGGPLSDQLSAYLTLSLVDSSSADARLIGDILVVDDDQRYCDTASQMLKKHGHRVTTASNGLEGLGHVLREAPDAVVSDVQMPVMDGWQFLRILRSRPSVSHIPVIFLTTLTGEDDRLRGYRDGVDDYIAKPFTEGELLARVERVLQRTRIPRTTANRNALRGDLAQVSLGSVLSFIELEKRTGQLMVIAKGELTVLHIRQGNVVQVDLPAGQSVKPGLERLMRVLAYESGQFELTTAEVTVEDSIQAPTSFALLEFARQRDEGTR